MARSQHETPSSERLVLVGMITGAQGLKGKVRIQAYTADPAAITAYGPLTDESGRTFRLGVTKVSPGRVIALVEGVADRNQAEALKGTRLFVARAQLPEPEADQFYHADLIGLEAELADGSALGRVSAVQDFGAGDILEIERPDGTQVMVPFRRSMVPVVDLARGRVVIDPPAGLLDAPQRRRAARSGRTKP